MSSIFAAFDSGYSDGASKVCDLGATPAEVEKWFAPGTLNPDEALLNACTEEQLHLSLGLTLAEILARGEDFTNALEQYNRGYHEGARIEALGWGEDY